MGFVKRVLSLAFLAAVAYFGYDMFMGYDNARTVAAKSDAAVAEEADEQFEEEDASGSGVPQDGDKGGYDENYGLYTNETYGFSLEVPASWTRYTVNEAIQCSTIQKEYADCYFLIASPNGSPNTSLTIDMASCPEDVWSKYSETDWKNYASHNRKPLLWEVKDIGGLTVYRAGFKVGGAYRENNLFVANRQLMEIYIIGRSAEDPNIYEMRSAIDYSLALL